jgi:hypothetical protein
MHSFALHVTAQMALYDHQKASTCFYASRLPDG